MSINGTSVSKLELRDDNESWSDDTPLLMKVARVWARLSPRAKGAMPRWIGRNFGRRWKHTITTQSGCRLAVDPANLDIYTTIQNAGYWEPKIREACIRALREGDVMFDVGANAGAISNEVGLACDNVLIKAFEPQTELAKLVGVSAALNGLSCIDVYPVAVGDIAGTINLYKPAHALHASTASSGEPGEKSVSCPIIRLDDLVKSGELPTPNLIKVDVEGGELNVLKGAQWLIAEYEPLIIFEANTCCDRFSYERNDLVDLISNCGEYRFFAVCEHDTLAVPTSRATEFSALYPEITMSKRAAA